MSFEEKHKKEIEEFPTNFPTLIKKMGKGHEYFTSGISVLLTETCLDKQKVREVVDTVSHEDEPDGIDGSWHEGYSNDGKGTYLFDKRCARCRLEKELRL
jgi:hypothetical protein